MQTDDREEAARRAVAELYHAYFTGIILSTVTRCGADRATELVYEIFSKQRTERFLPGLKKLGLDGLPHAVAAAQYHYLSNHIGGVAVEYMYESDRKAWIRYSAPRWIWSGAALCAVPSDVSKAMLRGWHARNGVSLGNPRLGFVCTKQAVDGDSGLEGYYYEYDHDLEPKDRLRFARDEDAPDFDPATAPTLPTDTWPSTRLAKAHRNYAIEYVRTALPTAINLWGTEEAVRVLGLAARMIGMQFYHELAGVLGLALDKSPEAFATFMEAMINGHGDQCEVVTTRAGVEVRQRGWAFMADVARAHPAVADIWSRLFEGALAAHNHRLTLDWSRVSDADGGGFHWTIGAARD